MKSFWNKVDTILSDLIESELIWEKNIWIYYAI